MQDEPRKRRSALIVEDETFVGMGLQAHLEKLGYRVVGQAASSGEAIGMFRSHKPDLVLVDVRLDGADGIDLAARLLAERKCPMIIVSAFSDPDMIQRATAAGVYGYLLKPVSWEGLAAQISIAVARFEEQQKCQSENAQLCQNLEARKWADKAKAILMKRLNLDEPAAHRWLQVESQKRRITIADMARQLVDTEPQSRSTRS